MANRMDRSVPCSCICCVHLWWWGVIISLSSAGTLIGLGVTFVKDRVEALDFLETNCTVVDQVPQGYYESCGCGKNCKTSYPCYQILVNYTTGQDGDDQESMVMYQDEAQLNNGCSFSKCHRDVSVNERYIDSILEKFHVNFTSSCFYNPDTLSEVIATRNTMIIHFLLWPAIGVVLFTGLAVATTKTCCKATEMDKELKRARKENRSPEEIRAIVASYTNVGYEEKEMVQEANPHVEPSNTTFNSSQYWQPQNEYWQPQVNKYM